MSRLAVCTKVSSPEAERSSVVVLAVGDVFSLSVLIESDLAGDATTFVDFAEVTPDLMHVLGPEVVVSSVLGRNFDCIDLAERLCETGFGGCYRLIGHGIPEPALVLREIRALFPGLHVEMDTGGA